MLGVLKGQILFLGTTQLRAFCAFDEHDCNVLANHMGTGVDTDLRARDNS